MATCTQCGAELKPGTKFCENCGAKVSVPQPAAQPAAVPRPPVQPTQAPPPPPQHGLSPLKCLIEPFSANPSKTITISTIIISTTICHLF